MGGEERLARAGTITYSCSTCRLKTKTETKLLIHTFHVELLERPHSTQVFQQKNNNNFKTGLETVCIINILIVRRRKKLTTLFSNN